jgi:hypothetical protein
MAGHYQAVELHSPATIVYAVTPVKLVQVARRQKNIHRGESLGQTNPATVLGLLVRSGSVESSIGKDSSPGLATRTRV